MTRIDPRPWAGVTLFATVLAYVGCSSTNSTDPSPQRPSDVTPAAAASAPASTKDQTEAGPGSNPQKLLANMGNPAAVLIVSGQQDSYMEPCGCSVEQYGGLIRRYDLVERLHKQNWPTASIDLGGLTKDPAGARGGFDQAKYKFMYSLKALALLKYNAMALSAEDLRFGVGEALGLFDTNLGDETKIVAANVEPAKGFDRVFQPSLVATAGPVRLGITAVVEPDSLKKLGDPDKDVLLPAIKQPHDVLRVILADLETKSDYQVLMVQGPPELAKRLAEAYPGFDIVVSTSDYADPLQRDGEQLNGGKTWLVSVGKKGKYVGVFGFYADQSPRLRYHLVTLNKRYDGPGTPMKNLIEDEYRSTLKAAGVVENFVRRDYVNGATGATFVGAESCNYCHPKTYAFWSTTEHAKGFTTLLHDPKPNTAFDAECITCHTTGFEYTSGWKSEAETSYLAGNQCENCHGPGSKHAVEPVNTEYRKLMRITSEQANKNRLCIRCHDEDNSPKFEFDEYWGQIEHNNLDKYDDPKVHRPMPPKLARDKPADTPK